MSQFKNIHFNENISTNIINLKTVWLSLSTGDRKTTLVYTWPRMMTPWSVKMIIDDNYHDDDDDDDGDDGDDDGYDHELDGDDEDTTWWLRIDGGMGSDPLVLLISLTTTPDCENHHLFIVWFCDFVIVKSD